MLSLLSALFEKNIKPGAAQIREYHKFKKIEQQKGYRALLLKNDNVQKLRTSPDESIDGIWPKAEDRMPWFDHSDALDKLSKMKVSDQERQHLKQFVQEGVCVADVLSPAICDELVAEMEQGIWGGEGTYTDLKIIGPRPPGDSESTEMFHEDLQKLTPVERETIMRQTNWRIHGLNTRSAAYYAVSQLSSINHLASCLFNEPAEVGFALSFGYGSEQTLHQDYAQFHIFPRNYLIGVWIALEDITADSGPLVYYPGSHKMGYWDKHSENYPANNIRTLSKEDERDYFTWLVENAKQKYEEKTLLIKKGQALFWHAALAHGGSIRQNRDKSRHSLIFHMVPKNQPVDKRLIIEDQ